MINPPSNSILYQTIDILKLLLISKEKDYAVDKPRAISPKLSQLLEEDILEDRTKIKDLIFDLEYWIMEKNNLDLCGYDHAYISEVVMGMREQLILKDDLTTTHHN